LFLFLQNSKEFCGLGRYKTTFGASNYQLFFLHNVSTS